MMQKSYDHVTRILFTLAVGFVVCTQAVSAQSIDRAVRDFQNGNYEKAAVQFYEVVKSSTEAGLVSEAQYGLAASFDRLNLNMAALKYYEDIAVIGSDHPYFDKAIKGLVSIAERVRDDFKIPTVIDALYDPNITALEKLEPSLLQRMHFIIGQHALNRGKVSDAQGFLLTVKPGNPSYTSAQYLLALIDLGIGQSGVKPNFEAATAKFEAIRLAISPKSKIVQEQNLRDLATLAFARARYEQAYMLDDGDALRKQYIQDAVALYKSIPRFSKAWPDSIFEQAWAHTVANDYGRALGAIESLDTPFFKKNFYPEARNLRAIVYYYNCQWDRVNSVVEQTKRELSPIVEQAQSLAQEDRSFEEWYELLEQSLLAAKANITQDHLLPAGLAYRLRDDDQFQKMQRFMVELNREASVFAKSKAFEATSLGQEMTDFALQTRNAFLPIVGRYVSSRFQDLSEEVSDILTRASLISLETKTAETDWLEQGRNIIGQVRARLPRPFVPDETFQFWWHRGEVWIDEIGYYEYTVKTECFE